MSMDSSKKCPKPHVAATYIARTQHSSFLCQVWGLFFGEKNFEQKFWLGQ